MIFLMYKGNRNKGEFKGHQVSTKLDIKNLSTHNKLAMAMRVCLEGVEVSK